MSQVTWIHFAKSRIYSDFYSSITNMNQFGGGVKFQGFSIWNLLVFLLYCQPFLCYTRKQISKLAWEGYGCGRKSTTKESVFSTDKMAVFLSRQNVVYELKWGVPEKIGQNSPSVVTHSRIFSCLVVCLLLLFPYFCWHWFVYYCYS